MMVKKDIKLIKLKDACLNIGLKQSKVMKDAKNGLFEYVQYYPGGILYVEFDKFYQQYIVANTINLSNRQIVA